MARFIDSPRYPGRRPANCADMLQLFGIKTGKWPDEGCPARVIQGIWVHVLPVDHASLRKGDKRNSSAHRCLATCPDCGKCVSTGRLRQHQCLQWLARVALSTDYDSDEHDDAHNAFADAADRAMTSRQSTQWQRWCLKATSTEIVTEALRILGLPVPTLPDYGPDEWNPTAHGG